MPAALLALLFLGAGTAARAQPIDLSHGGPVEITAAGDIEWHQNDQTVIARGDARAVRDNVTVTADVLTAHYRKKGCGPAAAGATAAAAAPHGTPAVASATPPAATRVAAHPGAPPAACTPGVTPGATSGATQPGGTPQNPADDTGGNEIYRLDADGHVNIYTQTDHAIADHAVYDIDQAVLVLTGHNLKLTTPQDVMTAKDSMEYWSQKHLAIGRGDAVVVTNDGRRVSADVLVGYTVDNSAPGNGAGNGSGNGTAGKTAPAKPPPPPAKPGTDPLISSSKLQKVDAFGHVEVRTATEIVTGDRGVYVPDTGIAVLEGHVHITRGDNQLNGNRALVNLKTGISRLLSDPGRRVEGLVVPQESGQQQDGQAKPAPAGAKTR